jgi:hypothetical protein
MPRVRRRRTPHERLPETTPELRAANARAAAVGRERLRRVSGEAPRMTDAEFTREDAWRERFLSDGLAAWRAAHPKD